MVQWTGEDQTDQRLASGCRNYRGSEWSSVALTKKLRALLASSSDISNAGLSVYPIIADYIDASQHRLFYGFFGIQH